MPMRVTHQAAAAPVTMAVYAGAVATGDVSVDYGPGFLSWLAAAAVTLALHTLLGFLAWSLSTSNDWDHHRFRTRRHFGAAMTRPLARRGYRWLRTEHDKMATHKLEIDDLHRGPTHCLEWCVLVGLLFYAAAWASVMFAPWAFWFGLAAFAGTASHVLLDWMTPSGVPLSITWNYVAWSATAGRRADRQVWRRHAAGWYIPFGEVSWWLRWIRIPWPVLADTDAPGCEPGLFHTNSGAEHLWVVPALYGVSALPMLAAIGMLTPLGSFLFTLPWLA